MNQVKYSLTSTSGLILEGGGMRGVFTCGVLDNLMDRGIRFPYTIGVSAGACNGLSYMSEQRGRGKFSNIDLLEKYRYIGLKQLIFKGNIMDFDLLFHKFPEEIIPYHYDKFAACKERFEMVTTSCRTGRACYYDEKMDPVRIIDIVKASSSLPFVSPISYVDGEPMLDGGIADSIPLLRARELGFDNNLVVLTRNKGYRKPQKPTTVPWFFYRKYPLLREAIRRRNTLYNEQIDLVERLEDKGELVVIRPQRPITVDRIERDTRKLLDLYNEGYECAAAVEFIK
ncbi:MAG: patatin family protein [Alistipes sp.]|nr:patatin family protein [Alistipes sp.]MBO5275798.1 patatin family protein [Alistipes sp.]